MIKEVSFYDFRDAFTGSDTYKNNFSYKGLSSLYDYLEDIGGGRMNFDMVAICCQYSEYDSAYEAMKQYQPEDMPIEGEEGDDLIEIEEKNEIEAMRWLEERTQVIKVEGGGVIISDF